MAYVYTVSHPLTDCIVYVGATKTLEKRIQQYYRLGKTNRPIDIFINELRNNHLLPKVEVIAQCNDDELFQEELFWIIMLKSWGYNLLNIKKNTHKKQIIKIRKSKYWSKDLFYVGNVFELGETTKRTFTATFKNYCRTYKLKLFLKYSIDSKTATIIAEKPPRKFYEKKGFWPKGEDRKQSTNKNNSFDPLFEIGGSIEKYCKDEKAFRTLKTQVSYYCKHLIRKRFNYIPLGNGIYKIIRIY